MKSSRHSPGTTDNPGLKRIHTKEFVKVSESNPVTGGAWNVRNVHRDYYDMHYPFELGIVITGKIRKSWNEYTRDLVGGDVWLCGVWEPHGYTLQKVPHKCVSLYILPEFLGSLDLAEAPWMKWVHPFSVPPEYRPIVRPEARPIFIKLARRMINVFEMEPKYRKPLLRLLVLEALVLLDKHATMKKHAPAGKISQVAKINRAVELIMKNRRFISLDEAARACGLSGGALNSIFRDVFNATFAEYALTYRVQRAAYMMVKSSMPKKAVAFEWGFTDYSHFYRSMKKVMHCTPQQFAARMPKQENKTSAKPHS